MVVHGLMLLQFSGIEVCQITQAESAVMAAG